MFRRQLDHQESMRPRGTGVVVVVLRCARLNFKWRQLLCAISKAAALPKAGFYRAAVPR